MSDEAGNHKVEYFELFFDLVYVYVLIQITRTIVADASLLGVGHGLLVLILVWWVWVAFTSLANVGLPPGTTRDWRQPLFAAAMGLLLVLALSIPEAFWANSKLFAFTYLGLALLALGGQWAAVRHDPPMRRAATKLGATAMVLPILLVVTSFVESDVVSVLLITVGIAAAMLAPIVSGSRAWRVSTAHLAERYSLFMLITMGETIISIGEGATKASMSALLISTVLLSFVLVVMMWRHYYTEVLGAGEIALRRLRGSALVNFARYGYTYLHLVMVAALVITAASLKSALIDVTTPLEDLLEALLAVGVGVFLLATATFSKLSGRRLRALTVVAIAALAVLAAVGPRLPTSVLIILIVIAAAIGIDPRSLGRSAGWMPTGRTSN